MARRSGAGIEPGGGCARRAGRVRLPSVPSRAVVRCGRGCAPRWTLDPGWVYGWATRAPLPGAHFSVHSGHEGNRAAGPEFPGERATPQTVLRRSPGRVGFLPLRAPGRGAFASRGFQLGFPRPTSAGKLECASVQIQKATKSRL